MISKALIIKLFSIVVVFVVAWTVWQRLTAVIDNYQRMYDIALLQKIAKEQEQEFNRKLDAKFESINKQSDMFKLNEKTTSNQDDIDKKWEEYTKDAIVQQYNKPVPAQAYEYTAGYYYGLFDFFIRSGLATIFISVTLFTMFLLTVKMIWQRWTDEKINRFLAKRGIS